jgi:CP family cyanate transporter-like MFS transporter
VPGPPRPAEREPLSPTLLVALLIAALALRPQLVGAGPLIPAIQAELDVSHAVAGLLGTIPVLCMGVFAPLAPLVAARIGTSLAIGLSIAAIGGFGLARALAADGLQLAATTLGIGVGMGIAGTLLPVHVRERLQGRPVAGTVAYSSGIQLGSAASAAVAVPLALVLNGWRGSLAVFSILTLVLVVPWLWLAAQRGPQRPPRISVSRADFTDRRGWLLAGVFALFGIVYYGLVGWLADAYVELGWTPVAAGALVGLLNVGALVGAVTIGFVTGRLVGDRTSLIGLGVLFAVASAGFVLLPAAAPLWALLAGYANGALFPLMLALPLRLIGSTGRAAGLTAVMLGVGYTVAAISPIGLGAVRDATGSFAGSLGVIALVAGACAVSLALVGRLPALQPERAVTPAG